MCPFTRDFFVSQGFIGFKSFRDLRSGSISSVPRVPGIYVVIRESSVAPRFLSRGTGGFHDGRDPTVSVNVLEQKWIDGCQLVYVGKGAKLRSRIQKYMRFGEGEPASHHGGRYIWQLVDSPELIVAWRACDGQRTHRADENELLRKFMSEHDGRFPFANIDGPTLE